ncbi:TetR family transcriptional regulator [Pseudoroseomonas cervicalis]|uniref:TetR family transcriptional regulator n=1 Tax=Teichococcus cervicalis TaxID=204525 RepID=UPI00278A67D9|nr:TetR family transcriptional regulator [Pseudoroseomonas cervicalis]MDQ1077900.1 AcrR family transcriptional regulator [Pseudoroseomonas cervicalis]
MSPSDESTRERILEAARREFAEHGIAGARINRIAAAARTSKERLYAYFRDKQQLLDTIKAQQMAEIAVAVPMDPADLPGYVGRLFDYLGERPEMLRIASWAALEGGECTQLPPGDPRRCAYEAKLDKLRQAQRAGLVDASWEPLPLLSLMIALAGSWSRAPCEVHALAGAAGLPRQNFRAAVEEAARRLLQPRAGG